MFKPLLATLAAGLWLIGCAANDSIPMPSPPPAGDEAPLWDEFTTPILQDRAPPRMYTPAQGRALERRQGYRVDHGVAAQVSNNRIRHLVLHYTSGDDAAAFRALTGPEVSVHYLVLDRPGMYQGRPVVMQMVDERRRAWHAGVSRWKDRSHLNDTSIGVEIVNQGFTPSPEGMVWHPFSQAQIQAVIALTRDIVKRYAIAPTNVVGHADIAPGRKVDPGPFFPWQRLAAAGVGAWPERAMVVNYLNRFKHEMPSVAQLQRGLAAYGYAVPISGVLDRATRCVLQAFQMHFRPARYNGVPDRETAAILFALLEKYRGSGIAHELLTS